MERGDRRKNKNVKTLNNKNILYLWLLLAGVALIVVALFMHARSLNTTNKESTLNLEQIAQNTESASTEMGKTVEESKGTNTAVTNVITNTTTNSTSDANTTNTTNTTRTSNTSKTNTSVSSNSSSSDNKTSNNTAAKESKTQEKAEEPKKNLEFAKPVDGEIVKDYAKDNLLYSNTLDEWTTHTGIDIKADKGTVVKAAEAGTIKSIKNDPRYGLTIVIEHNDTYQTVYSNLLSSEFVVEGEKVEKGQSIGTVGNTAPFEIADEPHLHFEILKNSLQEDPNNYIK